MKLLMENWRKFIKEDAQTREEFSKDLCDMGGYEHRRDYVDAAFGKTIDPDFSEVTKTGRGIKKLYHKHADRAFLDSLITIHWTEKKGLVHLLAHGSSKDELSCAAYLPGETATSVWADYGVVVDGYISLLANDMNDVMSGGGKRYTLANPERTKSSGANKGIGLSYQCTDYVDKIFVFDEEDWNPAIRKHSRFNEAFVDNWKITAIISPEISHQFLKRIVHRKMKRPDIKIITPEQVGEL